jgi:hypothetical protein
MTFFRRVVEAGFDTTRSSAHEIFMYLEDLNVLAVANIYTVVSQTVVLVSLLVGQPLFTGTWP